MRQNYRVEQLNSKSAHFLSVLTLGVYNLLEKEERVPIDLLVLCLRVNADSLEDPVLQVGARLINCRAVLLEYGDGDTEVLQLINSELGDLSHLVSLLHLKEVNVS